MHDEYDQTPQEIAAPAEPDNKRRKFTLTEKLAAAYLQLATFDDDSQTLIPVICPHWAKTVSADKIVKVFERWHDKEHRVALGLGGTNHPVNVQFMTRLDHQTVKTPADRKAMAKADRIAEKHAAARAKAEEFTKRLLAPSAKPERPKKKPQWKPMPGTKASNWKHCMNGTWERRDREKR